ncbi:hypothetical protein FF38_10248 [Lucilia cuprina]|uniref:Uncharacterized protein n=1 Tax=Lucilia cuprina TaxID=7375 RepID=A0A0L0CJV2_LUCCU|nr:hypothetical protein FF38_10248 [Lucilia cuprina]
MLFRVAKNEQNPSNEIANRYIFEYDLLNCLALLKRNRVVVERAYDDIGRIEEATQLVVTATQLGRNWSTLAFAYPNTAPTQIRSHLQQVQHLEHLFGILDLFWAELPLLGCGFLGGRVHEISIKNFVVAAIDVAPDDDAAVLVEVAAVDGVFVDVAAAVGVATVLFLAVVVEFSAAVVVEFVDFAIAAADVVLVVFCNQNYEFVAAAIPHE